MDRIRAGLIAVVMALSVGSSAHAAKTLKKLGKIPQGTEVTLVKVLGTRCQVSDGTHTAWAQDGDIEGGCKGSPVQSTAPPPPSTQPSKVETEKKTEETKSKDTTTKKTESESETTSKTETTEHERPSTSSGSGHRQTIESKYENKLKNGSAKLEEFDTSSLGGDPTGKNVNVDIIPAQREVIPAVVEEKLETLRKDPGLELTIVAWRSPNGKLYIQDGQHRFVASAVLGRKVWMIVQKLGAAAFSGTWKDTVKVVKTPAKDTIKKNMNGNQNVPEID